MVFAARPLPAAVAIPQARPAHVHSGTLSVMTYNVKGLPFPAAFGRPAALAQIGERLGELRLEDRQPDVVVLQEAFIPEAKAIARLAGYRYMVTGPKAADAANTSSPAPRQAGRAEFAEEPSWSKGETEGKFVDSGLVVMSNYPIVGVQRMAFGAGDCAGYDCLSAKGAMIAWIQVPGQAQPVAIADTHLNSRRASGVSVKRANTAYRYQMAALKSFVEAQVSRSTSLIFAGDFNVGRDPERRAQADSATGTAVAASEATSLAAQSPAAANADIAAVLARGKDKQFFRAGIGLKLGYLGMSVPFGNGNGGPALSDHLGYVVTYSIR